MLIHKKGKKLKLVIKINIGPINLTPPEGEKKEVALAPEKIGLICAERETEEVKNEEEEEQEDLELRMRVKERETKEDKDREIQSESEDSWQLIGYKKKVKTLSGIQTCVIVQ